MYIVSAEQPGADAAVVHRVPPAGHVLGQHQPRPLRLPQRELQEGVHRHLRHRHAPQGRRVQR